MALVPIRGDGMPPWALEGRPIPSHSDCSPDSSRLLATPVYYFSFPFIPLFEIQVHWARM